MNSEHPLIRAFANVSFSPGTASKRFVRDMAARSAEFELSARAEAYAWRIGYRIRRQLCAALAAEVVARKVDHVWHAEGSHDAPLGTPHMRCANCRIWLRDKRDENAPCPGPPAAKQKKAPADSQKTKKAEVEWTEMEKQEDLFG